MADMADTGAIGRHVIRAACHIAFRLALLLVSPMRLFATHLMVAVQFIAVVTAVIVRPDKSIRLCSKKESANNYVY